MKWPLFVISLFALWVAFNALYMLPGRYTAFNFELAAIGIGVGILTAWLSGRRFAEADSRRRKRGAIMQSPGSALHIRTRCFLCYRAAEDYGFTLNGPWYRG